MDRSNRIVWLSFEFPFWLSSLVYSRVRICMRPYVYFFFYIFEFLSLIFTNHSSNFKLTTKISCIFLHIFTYFNEFLYLLYVPILCTESVHNVIKVRFFSRSVISQTALFVANKVVRKNNLPIIVISIF